MQYVFMFLVRRGVVVILMLLLAPIALAQQSGPATGPRTGRTDALQLELRRQAERELIDRALAARPAPRGSSPGLAEFRDDFLRLQVVNNDLLKAAAANPLDLKFIAKSAAEVRKLGQRLKTNLVLPKTGETRLNTNAAVEPLLEQLRPSLLTLDKLIDEFVSSPVFESAKVVDAQLSAKARRSLDEIIVLGGQIKKSSEKLSQTTARSR